MRLNPFCSWRL